VSRPSKKEPKRSTKSSSTSLGRCKIVKKTKAGGSRHTVAERIMVDVVAKRSPWLLVFNCLKFMKAQRQISRYASRNSLIMKEY